MQLTNLVALGLASRVAAQQLPSLTEALASQNASLSTLAGLLGTLPDVVASLNSAQNITILAPSNDALETLLSDNGTAAALAADPGMLVALLQYHVLNGTYYSSVVTDAPQFIPTLLTNETYANVTGGQRVEVQTQDDKVVFLSALKEKSTVTNADLNFTAGTIHIIDKVLSVPASISSTLLDANLTAALGAVTAAGVGETLESAGDLTIFVPSNAAFAAIANLAPNISTEALAGVLSYHVVAGDEPVYSTDVGNVTLPTLQGSDLTVRVIDGKVFVNSAKVILTDIFVANGVVHVIDNVLNPMNTTAMPDPAAETQMPAFPGASGASDGSNPFTSGVPMPTTTAPVATNSGNVISTTTPAQMAPAMQTGAMGAAALFGAAAIALNM